MTDSILLQGSCLGLTPSWMQSPGIVFLFCGIRECQSCGAVPALNANYLSSRLPRHADADLSAHTTQTKHLARVPTQPLRRARSSHYPHHILRRLHPQQSRSTAKHSQQPMADGVGGVHQYRTLCEPCLCLPHV